MMAFRSMLVTVSVGAFVSASIMAARAVPEDKISYNFQVRPILADHCLKCHGQDEKQRKAKLRLDERGSAVEKKSVVPGKPDESELIKRILSTDDEEVMPPPKEHRPVSAEELGVLRKWITQGAEYEKHWSFTTPVAAPVPQIRNPQSEVRNPIDAFVLARLEREKIAPASPAAPEEWLRRVTLDLTGLPPTIAELDAFLGDESPLAFERVVDRLLASTAYGERMGSEWLDVARFADTYGRHEDHDCLTWPYRDWVVRAFNENLPFDKFVLWQTAGDMMPGATQDMYLATAFNRLAQQSNEAGSNEDEFRQEIVADRIRTNGIALLGLSLECARCHDHKYDPVTQKEYYQLAAFLNNIDECGLYTVYTENVPAPSLLCYEGDDERQHAEAKLKIRLKEEQRAAELPLARHRFQRWLAGGSAETPVPAKPAAHFAFESFDADSHELQNSAESSKPGSVRLKTKLGPGVLGSSMFLKGDNSVRIPDVGRRSRTDPFSFSIWLKPEKSQQRAVVVHNSRAALDSSSHFQNLNSSTQVLASGLSLRRPASPKVADPTSSLPTNSLPSTMSL